MKDPFSFGRCEVCGRQSTVAILIEGASESHEMCELHFGAFLRHGESDDVALFSCAFRGQSADLANFDRAAKV